jgi:hypothetical protein
VAIGRCWPIGISCLVNLVNINMLLDTRQIPRAGMVSLSDGEYIGRNQYWNRKKEGKENRHDDRRVETKLCLNAGEVDIIA